MVNERTWQLGGGICGIGFVVLSVASTFLYPQPPSIDSSPKTVLTWVHGHRVGIETGMAFGIFAALIFVWFAVHLRHRVDRSGTDPIGSVIAAITGALVAVYALGAIPTAALAVMDGQPGGVTDGSLVRLLIDLNQLFFAPAVGLAGAFMLASGVAILATGLLARWIGWLALIVAVFDFLEVAPALTFGNYHAGGWTVVGWSAFLGFLIMVLVLAVALLVSSRDTAETSPLAVPTEISR